MFCFQQPALGARPGCILDPEVRSTLQANGIEKRHKKPIPEGNGS